MNLDFLTNENVNARRMLNIGCGRRYHCDWTNLDLGESDPDVITHDVTKGLPFESSVFSAVYHSHLLEHLEPFQGRALTHECFRVLKPGGVLRIVVPDLECIARLYLETHSHALSGDETAKVNYNWMKLELLDQLVRKTSGGRMGRYMTSREIKNSDFVRGRVGDEMSLCQSHVVSKRFKGQSVYERLAKTTLAVRKKVTREMVRLLLGREAKQALDEGLFRNEGEVHRWMYDEFSLRELTEAIGFVDFKVCLASESGIAEYSNYELDAVDGVARKPDSIFVECRRPVPVSGAKAPQDTQPDLCVVESACNISSEDC